MNSVKLVFTTEDGEQLVARDKLDELGRFVSWRLEHNANKYIWKHDLCDGSFDFAKEHNTAFSIWEGVRNALYGAKGYTSEEQVNEFVRTCPFKDMSNLSEEDVKLFKKKRKEAGRLKEFGGHTSFASSHPVRRHFINNAHSGYYVKGRAWHLVSWNAQRHYSEKNPGITTRMIQDVNIVHTGVNPCKFESQFLAEYPGLCGTLICNKDGVLVWGINGNPIEVRENFNPSQCAFLVIDSTCANGSIIHADAWIEIRSIAAPTSRGAARRPENPWNALNEHVRWSSDGQPHLDQPNGCGPNREENYSDQAATGGAATHPIQGEDHQESDDSDINYSDIRNRMSNFMSELPENYAQNV